MAISIIRYVDTDTGSAGGDGSLGNPWDSISTAWGALAVEYGGDLTVADVQPIVLCSGAAPQGGQLITTALKQDATRYVTFRGDWNGGVWDASKFSIETTSANRGLNFNSITNNFARFERLQVRVSRTGNDNYGIRASGNGGGIVVDSCLIDLSGSPGERCRVIAAAQGLSTATVVNSILIAPNTTGSVVASEQGSAATLYLLNNTMVGGDTGVVVENGSIVAINCGHYGAMTASFGGTVTGDYNASDDATAPGANSHHNVTPVFVDAPNGDYMLDGSDTAWSEKGADLSTETFPVAVDIRGEPRVAPFDIGAFEAEVTGPVIMMEKPHGRWITYALYTEGDPSAVLGLTTGTLIYEPAVSGANEWVEVLEMGTELLEDKLWFSVKVKSETNMTLAPGEYHVRIPLFHPTAQNSGDEVVLTLVVT